MSTLKTHNLQSPDAGSVNIVMAPNAGMVVAGLSTYSNQINVGNNIKLGNAGVITATSFSGSGAALTGIDATALKDSAGNVKIQAQASGAMHTGIHTFTSDATFSGNVSIGGTLTYEDVTNIDAVGVITARSGILVTSGNVGIGSAIPAEKLDVAGHIKLDSGPVLESGTTGNGCLLYTSPSPRDQRGSGMPSCA